MGDELVGKYRTDAPCNPRPGDLILIRTWSRTSEDPEDSPWLIPRIGLVLAKPSPTDVVICQVLGTYKHSGQTGMAVEILHLDVHCWSDKMKPVTPELFLEMPMYARPDWVQTYSYRAIITTMCSLKDEKLREIQSRLISLLLGVPHNV